MTQSKQTKASSKSRTRSTAAVLDEPFSLVEAARTKAFESTAPELAFAHFRALAEGVPTADLAVFTGQPLVMLVNVKAALSAIDPHLVAAVTDLRAPRLADVFELPSLVLGLEFAVGRVPVAALSTGEIDRMLSEGSPWREIMLSFLEVASHPLLGLLPRERVVAIRQGTGRLDKAQDFVALGGVFAEFATALAGKHPFPADAIALVSELGATLVQQVRPGRALPQVAKRSEESILRDQFAALVVDRYDHLQVLATVAVGKRRADELLPALRSAVAFGSVAAPPPAPAGTPADGGAQDPPKK